MFRNRNAKPKQYWRLLGRNSSLCFKEVDAFIEQAVAEGAVIKNQPEDKFYGDRNAVIADPFGHIWFISTHIEDVPPEELKKRMEAFTKPPED